MNNLPKFFLDTNPAPETIKSPLPLNILVVGKVSTGKSSLLNALLGKSRKSSPFKVRAESGVTQDLEIFQLNPYLCLIDAPGLDDISNQDRDFFSLPFDVGILVVEGSADGRQKSYLDRLRQHCPRVLVVLNKIDQYDKWQHFVLNRLIQQWQSALGIDRIFPTCTFGFDPEVDFSQSLDLRGIEELKTELEFLLGQRWQEKQKVVPLSTLVAIVTPTIRSIAEAGTTPRRSPFILGLLAIALGELHQQYYQRPLSGEQTYRLLQLLPPIGFCWQGDASNFLLNQGHLEGTIIDSLTLLLGMIQAWARCQAQPQNLEDLRALIKTELEGQLPTHWSKTIESLLQKVLSPLC